MLRLRWDQKCTYSARATGRTSKKVVWFCMCNHSRCTSNPTPARAICDVAQATLLVQNSVARATIHVAPATRWTARAELRCTSNSSDCTCRTVAPAILGNRQLLGRKPRPRINIMQRCSIVAYLKCGISVSSICQETGTSRATVFRIMKSWKSGAIPNAQTKQLGRPKKTTTEQDAFIVDAVENNRKMVPRLVQRMLLEIYGVRLSLSRIR